MSLAKVGGHAIMLSLQRWAGYGGSSATLSGTSQGERLNRTRWWIGIAISVLFLFLVVRGVDPAQFAEKLRSANYLWLLPALVSLIVSIVLRAWRWRSLLEGQVGPARTFSVINVGYLLNNVLPFRLGDLARAYLISRQTAISGARGLSSIVLERVADLLAVVCLLAGVLVLAPPPALATVGGGALLRLLPAAGLTAALATLLVFALLMAAAARPLTTTHLVGRWLGRLPRLNEQRLTRLVSQLLDGLSALADRRRLVALLAWTAAIWAVSILVDWSVARAFIPETRLAASAFILALTGLGVSLPSSPAQMGVFEGPAAWALLAFYPDRVESAVAAVFVLHGLGLVVTSVLGAAYLAREGESLASVADSARLWLARMRSSEGSSP